MTNKPNNQSAQVQEQALQEAKEARERIIKKHLRTEDVDKGINVFFAYHEAMKEYAIEYASSKSVNQSAQENTDNIIPSPSGKEWSDYNQPFPKIKFWDTNQSAQEINTIVDDIMVKHNLTIDGYDREQMEDIEKAIREALQSKAVGYSLEDIEVAIAIANGSTRLPEGCPTNSVENILRFINRNKQSLTPTPIQTKGRVCNGKDIRCDNPSMDRNGNCRNCQGDMQTIL